MEQNKIQQEKSSLFSLIKHSIENRLRKLSAYLQACSAKLSLKKQRIAIILFCLLFGSFSVWVMVQSLLHRATDCFYVAPINIIKPLPKQEKSIPFPAKDPTHERIHSFMLYVDSLRKQPDSTRLLQKLFRNRPHLLDTLTAIEKIYHQTK